MLDEHKAKRKPAKDEKIQPRVRYRILTEMPQEQEPETEETLQFGHDEEMPGLAEKQLTGAESRQQEISEGSRHVPRPEVQSVIKGAMKNALQPPKSSLQKPARRPEILPDSSRPDEPGPRESQDLPRRHFENEKTGTIQTHDTGVENPPFCKNCGKKVPPAAIFCPMCGINLGVVSPVFGKPPGKRTIHKELPVKKKKSTPPK